MNPYAQRVTVKSLDLKQKELTKQQNVKIGMKQRCFMQDAPRDLLNPKDTVAPQAQASLISGSAHAAKTQRQDFTNLVGKLISNPF